MGLLRVTTSPASSGGSSPAPLCRGTLSLALKLNAAPGGICTVARTATPVAILAGGGGSVLAGSLWAGGWANWGQPKGKVPLWLSPRPPLKQSSFMWAANWRPRSPWGSSGW